ncbi:PhoD-like phosphatase-domain-containing protein [Catenaria anguillulae PL171]|uniref:PhoD-like phosphatase-domain-containing protein n=1 Tax=Catenaria anguillulae PL171 TaxID=765915 RepID=A0A1Y2HNG8_9FUNG|nr:PhoD-like phosphatase-domain-containing protein [Catenaria anguillulae PL171]
MRLPASLFSLFATVVVLSSAVAAAGPDTARVESVTHVSAAELVAHYDSNLVYLSPIVNRPDLAVKLPERKKLAVERGLVKRDGNPAGSISFLHGVASGDPQEDRVILWTKVTPAVRSGAIPVEAQVSTDPSFATILRARAVITTSEVDFSVKIDMNGLKPLTTYWYRFVAGGIASPVGKTKTLPAVNQEVDQFKMDVVSCSNMPHGYFHAYRRIAEGNADVVLHLGDYIYEYDKAGYKPKGGSVPADRDPQPPKLITSLSDYRTRHAQYKADLDLQALHSAKPMIAVWDHEFADNAFPGGAPDNSNVTAWNARKLAAARAYHEYMPIRPNLIVDNLFKVYRGFRIGKLIDLFMIDTRMDGRSEQAKGDPNARTLLGAEQRKWLYDGLADSNAVWKTIGNQVMFAPKPAKILAWEINALADDWNGYPRERSGLLDHLTKNKISNTVMLTGDLHASIASDIYNADKRVVMHEYVAPSITSATPAGDSAAGNFFLKPIFKLINKGNKFIDLYQHGWVSISFTKQRSRAEYWFVNSVKKTNGGAATLAKVLESEVGSNRITRDF